MSTTIDDLGVTLGLDVSGFADGANEALDVLKGLHSSINGLTKMVLPGLVGLGGIFGSATALKAFNNFEGEDANGFKTVAAGAKEYGDALDAASDAAAELSVIVGQVLAPGATMMLNAFTAIAPIIGAVIVHTAEFYMAAKDAIVGIVHGWMAGFGGVANMWETVVQYVSTGFNIIAGVAENWKILLQVAALSAALGFVQFGNQVVHILTEVIPKTLTWFADNWVDVFYTAVDYVTTILINLGQNIRDFFSALWSAITGGDFDFKFTPLTEGFKSTLKSLPEIAEREIGPLEKDLRAQLESAVGVAVEEMAPFVGPNANMTEGINAFIDKITEFFTPDAGGNLKTELAGDNAKSPAALTFGSKEAYSAIIAATNGVTDKQLQEQKRHTSLLQKIAGKKAKKAQI